MFATVERVQEEASGDEWESDLSEENSDIEESAAHASLISPNNNGC